MYLFLFLVTLGIMTFTLMRINKDIPKIDSGNFIELNAEIYNYQEEVVTISDVDFNTTVTHYYTPIFKFSYNGKDYKINGGKFDKITRRPRVGAIVKTMYNPQTGEIVSVNGLKRYKNSRYIIVFGFVGMVLGFVIKMLMQNN